MRKALVLVNRVPAEILKEISSEQYEFSYLPDYQDAPVSLTMSCTMRKYIFNEFPSFFDGFLPEAAMLEAFINRTKLDKYDYFSQLIETGRNNMGAVTIKEIK